MMNSKLLFLILLISNGVFAQYDVLVYHETNGFRHGSIQAGINMVTSLGNSGNQWTTVDSQSSSVFTAADFEVNGTYKYDVIIWCNTSGNNLLNAAERAAFEGYINSGGGFVGIHAATDTYRDQSWKFYNELVGGIVQTSPNHTSNNYNATMDVLDTSNAMVSHLGTTWNKSEEYYYWQNNGGQLSDDNSVLLRVRNTGGNSYDVARPMTWYKTSLSYDHDNMSGTPEITIAGFRSFYTALGHNNGDYNSDSNFRTMMEKAILWAANDPTLSIEDLLLDDNALKIFPNPVKDKVSFSWADQRISKQDVLIFDVLGRQMPISWQMETNLGETMEIDTSNWKTGLYLYQINTEKGQFSGKLLKQ